MPHTQLLPAHPIDIICDITGIEKTTPKTSYIIMAAFTVSLAWLYTVPLENHTCSFSISTQHTEHVSFQNQVTYIYKHM